MSFNTWDKLSKAQRDYPKPKYAVAVVDKALKKTPENPYLLTWKADLALQQHQDPEKISLFLVQAQKNVVTDTQLLSYMYRIFLESGRRRLQKGLSMASVGTTALNHWLAAAKTMQRKNERMGLWNELFYIAMQEDAWEDVRYVKGPPDKKRSHYALILITQLAAEQKFASQGKDDRMAQLQSDIALKFTKQSYSANQNDPIAVKDIRDFRFLAEIFKRQNRVRELQQLWSEPPNKALEQIVLHQHRDDLNSVMTNVLRELEDWPVLEQHCERIISATLSDLKIASNEQSKFWELCAWRWDVWDGLIKAVAKNHSPHEAKQIISSRMKECFDDNTKARDRPTQLTYMRLLQFLGRPLLGACEDYFSDHAQLGSCFEDLRGFMQIFTLAESEEFLKFLRDYMEKLGHPDADFTETHFEKYRRAELNVLKFQYLLALSQTQNPPHEAFQDHFEDSIKLSCMWPECPDLGFLAVYSLTNLHERFMCTEGSRNPFETTQNSRLLLQAAMYVRHLVEKDKDKQNRTLCLLAARLHLNLGLGTTGFRLYSHTKCKEMLLDTLSPYMLSRISQTHPFDVKGYGGFSVDEELARVVGTIERMEQKTASHLLTDVDAFAWDSALDILALKRKLNSSLTRHICLTERRRIARLRGESIEHIPQLDIKTYNDVSDNTDYGVFPNFECLATSGTVVNTIMPSGIPSEDWIVVMHFYREQTMRWLNSEVTFETGHLPLGLKHAESQLPNSSLLDTEIRLHVQYWQRINLITAGCCGASTWRPVAQADFNELRRQLDIERRSWERLQLPGSTGLKPEAEHTMFHEYMLMSCYGILEVLRATNKLVDYIREKITKPKGKNEHALKKVVPANYDSDLQESTRACYQAVRDMVPSYIDLLKSRGTQAIKAQVRWGPTGRALEMFLDDDDVDYYAKEYVDSALEAWKGVLKVKLK
ncbi:hypothetical protein EK21DRAFT_57934 [Setomelanomma holmii]|uniref:Uncharacterized protein n=1 Tax=Setomelanomma holmii TaxID=210430 RepID=A0A9P4HES3_9PLEO|nr:hypothetical protein EK21DRAFT_57934 [Setomelanomma holmii]